VEGFITIRLRTPHTPDSGSGLPDLGHDAYWLMKRIPELEFKDANGKTRPIGEKYSVIEATTSAVAPPPTDSTPT
jgi:hypothetical protein